MTTYVDELRDYGTVAYKRGLRSSVWCHLEADTLPELHAMAARLGLKRGWFQNKRIPHYDLTPSRRALAVHYGAVEVSAIERARQRSAERRAT